MSKSCLGCGTDITHEVGAHVKRTSRCRPCYNTNQKQYNAKYREKHRETARAASLAWRLNNPEKYEELKRRNREKQRESRNRS